MWDNWPETAGLGGWDSWPLFLTSVGFQATRGGWSCRSTETNFTWSPGQREGQEMDPRISGPWGASSPGSQTSCSGWLVWDWCGPGWGESFPNN